MSASVEETGRQRQVKRGRVTPGWLSSPSRHFGLSASSSGLLGRNEGSKNTKDRKDQVARVVRYLVCLYMVKDDEDVFRRRLAS